jgi:hypothetical protein
VLSAACGWSRCCGCSRWPIPSELLGQVVIEAADVGRFWPPHQRPRLYSFQDLMSLLVVAELRTERDMSLQHVRRLVKHLRSPGRSRP